MAVKTSALEMYNNWKQGVTNKQGNYQKGVQAGADWAAAATSPAAVQARNAGLARAMADGRIDAGIQRVGSQRYKDITAAKAQNWVTGVQSPQAATNAQAGFNKLIGFLNAGQNAISGMPRGDINANLQRAVAHAMAVHDAANASKGI